MKASTGHPGAPAPPAHPVRDGNEPPPRPKLRFRWLRLLGLLIPIAALALISTVFGMMMAVSRDLPDLDSAKEFQTAKNSVLLDRSGRQVGILADASRYVVTSNQIAQTMKDAVISMEDERFMENSGVDLRGIGRALVQDVVQRRAAQGASTITQQLIKLSLQAEDQRTVFQKLREAALAYHMTKQWSKSKILTTYLNRVYFGNGAYGVESAAKTYFGRNDDHAGCSPPKHPCAENLRPAEAALLTAIIASPSRFDPIIEPEAALRRRNAVLLKMRLHGKISREDYDLARAEPLPTRSQVEPPSLDAKNPYFASWVTAQLVDRLGAQRTYEGGLTVKTTIDPAVQTAAEKAIGTYLSSQGPQASLVAIDNRTGEVRAMVGGQDYRKKPFNLATQGQRQPGSSFKPFVLAQALREGISPDRVFESKKLTLRVKDERGRRETFRVSNDNNAYSGQSTIARALTFSDNSVFAQLGQVVGTKSVAHLIGKMGIRSPVSSNAALALGAPRHGVTTLDMAHAYETFATGGLRINGTLGAPDGGPVGIREIDVPGRKKKLVNHRRAVRVMSPGVADQTTEIMRTVVSMGSGKRAQYGGFAAGKTGTTENNVDAWFVGFSREMTVAVWVGYPDSGKPMQTEYNGEPVEGGTFPAAIWGTFMGQVEAILQGRDPKRAERTQDDGEVTPTDDEAGTSTGPVPTTTGESDATATDGDSSTSTGSRTRPKSTSGQADDSAGNAGSSDPARSSTPPPASAESGSGTDNPAPATGSGSSGSGSGTGGAGSGGAVPLE